jgi:hypothetical protein
MGGGPFLPRWLRAIFAWRDVKDNGTWAYQQNAVTGERRAVRIGACWSPKDFDWLERRPPFNPSRHLPSAGGDCASPRRECFAIAILHEGEQRDGIKYPTRGKAFHQSRLSLPYGFTPLYLVHCREKPAGAPRRYASRGDRLRWEIDAHLPQQPS